MKKLYSPLTLFAINLMVHAANTNVTTDSGLSVEMQTFYSDYLLDFARPNLVHSQFAQKHPIPQGRSKTINFRKKTQWAKITSALSEGVTPNGQALAWSDLSATVAQYGGYATISDVLKMTAVDDQIAYATELCGDQMGRSLDTITREVLAGGDNVQYADGQVAARYLLVGGDATASNNHYFTVETARRAARFMKNMKARKINGSYVAIIHPDIAYDLTKDSNWMEVKKYSDPTGIYNNEIGKLWDIRFVESTEAKIFHAEDLVAATSTNPARNLTVASVSVKTFTIDEALASAEATALVGRKVIIKGVKYTVASAAAGAAGAATITVTETVTGSPGDGDIVYPGEAGAEGRDVYATIVLGADAYGETEIEGGGAQVIVKPLGSGEDPLNQRATVGWKATKVAKRLDETAILRIETASVWQSGAN
jgi:N4-gp56 family major capsid protein